MKIAFRFVALAALSVVLFGCASQPTAPTVAVMPAANKPFEVFQQEQAICKQYAAEQVSGQAETANTKGLAVAAAGTALGTGLGAAAGDGRGAAVGAASGAVVGTAVGAGLVQRDQHSIQHQYDVAYTQCMYAKGNQVMSVGQTVAPSAVSTPYPPPPAMVYAAPPEAAYAPPPPRP